MFIPTLVPRLLVRIHHFSKSDRRGIHAGRRSTVRVALQPDLVASDLIARARALRVSVSASISTRGRGDISHPLQYKVMSSRTFTLDEAQTLLPILESLLKQAIEGKKLIQEVDAELQETAQRVFLNGGTLVDIVPLARRKAERERAIQRINDSFDEIDAT